MTPFDHFMKAFAAWLGTVWYLWIAMAVVLMVVVAAMALAKIRARARRRVPQYRRQLPQ